MNGLQLRRVADTEHRKRQINISNVGRVIKLVLPESEYVLISGVKHFIAMIQRRKLLAIAVDRVDDAFGGIFASDAQV